jgi:YceI-like domain
MKKILFVLLCAATVNVATAQDKIYATKSGVIKFFSNSPLEKIEGINSQTICKLNNKTGQLVFLMLIKGFKFDNSLLEDHFNENYMESTKFPKADFKGNITNIATVNFAKDGSYPVAVAGALTIHGVTKQITEKGTIEIKAGKVSIKSKFNIKVKEYGIKGEYIGDKIANEVETTVACKLD